jgi:phosphatidylserine/phosphatidylglycerophosphate/cardiolipin synthase-like enzyme
MLPACDRSQPTACAASNTTCVASAATVTKPGDSPANVCMSPADRMVDEVYKAVAGATSTVDITSLEPMDGRFMLGFRNAVTYLAHTGRNVTIRFLYGNIPFHTTTGSVTETIRGLVDDAISVKDSELTVYAGYLRSGTLAVTGWNHSKTIIVDSAKILVGGENWIAKDYLGADPVFDLNMKLQG